MERHSTPGRSVWVLPALVSGARRRVRTYVDARAQSRFSSNNPGSVASFFAASLTSTDLVRVSLFFFRLRHPVPARPLAVDAVLAVGTGIIFDYRPPPTAADLFKCRSWLGARHPAGGFLFHFGVLLMSLYFLSPPDVLFAALSFPAVLLFSFGLL